MRAVKLLFGFAVVFAAASMPACSCTNGTRELFNDGGSSIIGTITVDPTDVTLDMTAGSPPQTASFTVTFHGPKSDSDVTALSTYALTDMTLGVMNGNVFTTGTDHGGSTILVIGYTPPTGPPASTTANIHVKVHGSFQGPNCGSCAPFPPDSASPCAAGAEATVVYPPDGVLLPPNIDSGFEIHYTTGSGDTMFEIDFQNAATDVRITTMCDPVTDTRGTAVPNGCKYLLDPQWDFIAKSNKGGDPIVVTVRATTDGTCASPSTNTTKMSVAQDDMLGGIYYWKSTVTAQGTGGEIWRKSFGDAMPEELISPMSGSGFDATCYGCHFLSRDGLRMTISADDSDSDDEYTDVSMGLADVASKMFITMISYAQGQAQGFQTFSNDHSLYLASNGNGDGSRMAGGFGGTGATNLFFIFNGTDGSDATPPSVTAGPSGARPTMPDWSLDNRNVVFVMPQLVGWGDGFGSRRPDDTHVYGGSLWILPYSGNGVWGQPAEIVTSNGDNNYYPSFSPDGTLIAYNHVPLQGSAGALDTCNATTKSCPNDSFSNPKARVQIIPFGGNTPTPVDLEQANGSPASSPVDVSNSWPRWTPFVQQYKGGKLLWLTFSSTRDYGLRVRNHVMVGGQQQVQCYPPDSAEDPNGGHGQQFPGNCQQPQLWMAAVDLSATETGGGGDPSYPAFWLPFQDIATHNHAAQWTSQIVTMPMMGCIDAGQDCSHGGTCCQGICLSTGTCGIP